MKRCRSLTRRHSPRGASLFFFLTMVTGCSTMKQLHLPGEVIVPAKEQKEVLLVQVGETVTLFLKSGEEVRGEVVEVDLEKVVLGWPGNYGYREESYYSIEIDRIEAGRSTGVGRFGGGMVMGATVAFIIIGVGLAAGGGINPGY